MNTTPIQTPQRRKSAKKSKTRTPETDTRLLDRATSASQAAALDLVDSHRDGLTQFEASARLDRWGPTRCGTSVRRAQSCSTCAR